MTVCDVCGKLAMNTLTTCSECVVSEEEWTDFNSYEGLDDDDYEDADEDDDDPDFNDGGYF